MKNLKQLAALALIILTATGTQAANKKIYHKGWIDFNKNGRMDIFENPKMPVEARVNDLLRQMTMEEKTCQMTTLYGSGRILKDDLPTAEWKTRVWKDGIGNIDEEHNGVGTPLKPFITDARKHVEALHEIQRWFVEETRLGIPVDFSNEGIHGLCHYQATYFPAQCGQGATWNRDLIRRIADIEATEADILGYTNIYSPILDIATDPRWGRCVETYGEDAYLVGQLGLEMVRGLQAHRVVSTPKHYVAYSSPVGGRDDATRTDPHITEQALHELYLEPFRRAVQEGGALGIMSSYNDYNGEPISGSYYFLTELLRNEFGFRGYVVSDSEALEYLYNKHRVAADYEDAAALAVNAGLNIRTNFTQPETYIEPLRKAVQDGKISEEILNRRVAEILRVKFWLGLFDNPYRGNAVEAGKTIRNAEAQKVSLEAARQSLVLLKNDSNRLPLSKSLQKIAVIGPNANEKADFVSRYGARGANIITVYEAIRHLIPDAEVGYTKGCDLLDTHFPESELMGFPLSKEEKADRDAAVALAKEADVAILVLGGNNQIVGESLSRTDLNLPGRQEELLEAVYHTGTPVVLVLLDGRACTINFAARNIPAILHGWYPGEFTGLAVAEALFGDYNPGGHLAITFPKSVGQIPFHFPFKPGSDEKASRSVWGALYPFGHGLSYTTFEYFNLRIQKQEEGVKVTCEIKNTGTRSGDEVPQLYLHDEVSSVTAYTKVLRGFERIHLEPGETKIVTFMLHPHDFALWGLQHKFIVEPGTFRVMIGRSSQDIKLEDTLTLN